MHKHRNNSLKAIVSLAVLATAIAVPEAADSRDKDGKILIAVTLQTEQEPVWHLWTQIMTDEAAKEGATIIFQYANRDPARQAAQVEQMLAQNPDVFIFNPVNSATAAPMIDEIHANNIPVVSFDDIVQNSKTDFLVTRDNYRVGVMQATEALKFAPKGNYAFIKGSPAWNGWSQVVRGYDDTLKGNPDIKIVFDQNADWDPSKAQSLVENALSANEDNIAAVVTMNDGMAAGVVQAIISRELAGKVFVSGLNAETQALRSIASGAQTMTVYDDLYDYAVASVEAAVMLANGETPPSDQMTETAAGDIPTHLVPITLVTKDNLCDVIKNKIAPGWTSVEAVFDKADACP